MTNASLCLANRRFQMGSPNVGMIVKAEGPSGRAKIHSDEPKHALGLVQYLRTIGYKAWIEDANGNEIEEAVLKKLNQPYHRSN